MRSTGFLLLILPLAIDVAIAQQGGRAEASAHASATGGECKTVTHRVVVENGKVVVDERTENGKPVGGGGGGRPLPIPPMPGGGAGGVPSADELLRQLQEQVRRQMEAQGGALPPMPAGGAEPATAGKPVVPVAPRPRAGGRQA